MVHYQSHFLITWNTWLFQQCVFFLRRVLGMGTIAHVAFLTATASFNWVSPRQASEWQGGNILALISEPGVSVFMTPNLLCVWVEIVNLASIWFCLACLWKYLGKENTIHAFIVIIFKAVPTVFYLFWRNRHVYIFLLLLCFVVMLKWETPGLCDSLPVSKLCLCTRSLLICIQSMTAVDSYISLRLYNIMIWT